MKSRAALGQWVLVFLAAALMGLMIVGIGERAAQGRQTRYAAERAAVREAVDANGVVVRRIDRNLAILMQAQRLKPEGPRQ